MRQYAILNANNLMKGVNISMAKRIILTAVASLLSAFLIFMIVRHTTDILRPDGQAGGQTVPTTQPQAPTDGKPEETIPETPAVPETTPTQTQPQPSQEPTKPQENNTPTTPSVTPSQPTTQPQELPQWKQMYIAQATVWRTKYDHFALVYIDGDDIPELYMYGNNQSELCAYRSDSVNPQKKVLISQRMNGMGGGNYCKKSGKVLNVCAEDGYLAMYVYELTDIFRQTFYGREDKSVNPPAYYIGNYTGAVSEEEFKNTVNQYIDTSKTEILHKDALTLDAFVEYVKNF